MFFDHLINEQNTQAINEAKIYAGNGYNLSVTLDPNRNYGGNTAYFKFADNEDFNAAKRVIRISFIEPVYIVHNNQDKMTRKEIKWLVKTLVTPYKKDNSITIWQALIRAFNTMPTSTKLPEDLPIPDYTKLETR